MGLIDEMDIENMKLRLDGLERDVVRKAAASVEVDVRVLGDKLDMLKKAKEDEIQKIADLALRFETLQVEMARHIEEVDRFMKEAESKLNELWKHRSFV